MTSTKDIIPRDPVTGEIDEEWLLSLPAGQAREIVSRFRVEPRPTLWARYANFMDRHLGSRGITPRDLWVSGLTLLIGTLIGWSIR